MNEKEKSAAKAIQMFWRKKRSKLPKDLCLYLKEFKAATINDIGNGKYDKPIFDCINHCVARNNRVGLQALAYSLFSGLAVDAGKFFINFGNLQFILHILLLDKTSDSRDIGTVLKDTYLKWKELIKTKTITNPLKQVSKKETYSWTGNDVISISNGGGLFHIMDFLKGRSQGYRLEGKAGLGLQVSPNDTSRNFHYATGEPRLHFDRPATFRAKVPAKYLTSASRSYEAGLRPEAISALIDIEIDEISEESLEKLWFFRIDEISIYEYYPTNEELRSKLLASIKKLEGKGVISVVREEKLTEASKINLSLIP